MIAWAAILWVTLHGSVGAQTRPDPPHRVLLAPQIETSSEPGQRWYARPLSTQRGTVVTFDADQISILLSGQTVPTRYSSQRVVEIELTETPSDQAAALESFEKQDFATALPALVRSISDHDASSRPSVWRQQWLSMLAAQAAARSGRGDVAIELVDQLDARPLPALMIGLLPIDWTGEIASSDDMISAATERAGSKSLAVKLVAASWLLRSQKYREAAESALRRLASQSDRKFIAGLAEQLLWRTKTPPELEAGLWQWETQINRLPMALQTGPMVSLLHLVRRAGLKDDAKKWEMTLEVAAPTWHPEL